MRPGGFRGASLLDVGSGNGELLSSLARVGFDRMLGIDPFGPEASDPGLSIELRRSGLEATDRQFDFVIFNHSIEHVPDPKQALEAIESALTPRGAVLIRTPLADSRAFRNYGVNWIQLDPPRHTVIQTRKSIGVMIGELPFKLVEVIYDSNAFQIWGSELARSNIPLRRVDSKEVRSRFNLRMLEREAQELNSKSVGDQAAFILLHCS
jgi:SAM-dependent methyltransferase